MVRSATYRASKYASKLVGDVTKNRIDAQRDSMIEQATTQFSNIAAAETATKEILVAAGINTMLIPFYLSFARQCYSVSQKHSGVVATNEVCIKALAWQR